MCVASKACSIAQITQTEKGEKRNLQKVFGGFLGVQVPSWVIGWDTTPLLD